MGSDFIPRPKAFDTPYKKEDFGDWVTKQFFSALYGAGEIFGMEAPYDIKRFRAEAPFGWAGEFAGYTAPYLGWTKAAKALPMIGKLGTAAAQMVSKPTSLFKAGQTFNALAFERPALASAARMVAELAPLEATRVATSLLANKPLKNISADAGLSLGLEALFGAAGGALAKYGRNKLQWEKLLERHATAGDLREAAKAFQSALDDLSAAGKGETQEAREIQNLLTKTRANKAAILWGPGADKRVRSMREMFRSPEDIEEELVERIRGLKDNPDEALVDLLGGEFESPEAQRKLGAIARLELEESLPLAPAPSALKRFHLGVGELEPAFGQGRVSRADIVRLTVVDDQIEGRIKGRRPADLPYSVKLPGRLSSDAADNLLLASRYNPALYHKIRGFYETSSTVRGTTFHIPTHADIRLSHEAAAMDTAALKDWADRFSDDMIGLRIVQVQRSSDGLMTGIKKNGMKVGEGHWVVQEKDNGLFHHVLELDDETARFYNVYTQGTVEPAGLELAAGKTNKLYLKWSSVDIEPFTGNTGAFAKLVADQNALFSPTGRYITETERAAGVTSDLYDDLMKTLKYDGVHNYVSRYSPNMTPEQRLAALSDSFPELRGSGALAQLRDVLDEYMTPAMFQLRNHPLARHALQGMVRGRLLQEATVNRLLIGRLAFDEKRGAALQLMFNKLVPQEEGLLHHLARLDELDMKAWNELYRDRVPYEKIQEMFDGGQISERLYKYLNKVVEVDKYLNGEEQGTRIVTGHFPFSPLDHHYLVPHSWRGEWRVRISDTQGVTEEMLGATSKAEAELMRGWAMEKANQLGVKIQLSDPFIADRSVDRALAKRLQYDPPFEAAPTQEHFRQISEYVNKRVMSTPASHNLRTEVGGYITQFTKKQLGEIVSRHIQQRMRHIMSMALRDNLDSVLTQVRVLDGTEATSHVARILSRRLDDIENRQGDIGRVTNEVFDTFLSPVLGKNSATKISNATAKGFMHLTLGAGNLGFSLINALTMLQTVLPEIAVAGRQGSRLFAERYQYLTPLLPDGSVGKPVGFIDAIRMLRRTFGRLANPDDRLKGLLARAVEEDVLGGKLEGLINGGPLRGAMKGDFADKIVAMSEWSMMVPERFSRGYSYTLGLDLGEMIFGSKVDDEILHRFASDFTHQTQYRYAAFDKASLFSGPGGSMFGLFKNWMLHYSFATLDYAGEALRYVKTGGKEGMLAPLLWQTAGLTTVGGLAAVPGYALADGFVKMASNRDIMNHVYDHLGDEGDMVSDSIFYGLPSILGISLTTQATGPFNNPVRDITMLGSFVQVERMKALGTAMSSSMKYFEATRQNPLRDPLVRDQLLRTFAPKTFYRLLTNVTGEALRSYTTGYATIKDVTLGEAFYHTLGINPLRLEKAFRISRELWGDLERRNRLTSEYGRILFEANEANDNRMRLELFQQSQSYGLSWDSIVRSSISRKSKSEENMIERNFDVDTLLKWAPSLRGVY